MACTIASFRARFPEFSDDTEYPDARVQLFLDTALIFVGDESKWCSNKFDLAHCYLAAHMLTLGTAQEAGDSSAQVGPVTSKSAGGVSVSRAYVPSDKNEFDAYCSSTSYGQMYILLRNSCFIGVLVAIP